MEPPEKKTNPTAYAIRNQGAIVCDEADKRLCIYSEKADVFAAFGKIKVSLPEAEIVGVQMMDCGVVPPPARPKISGPMRPKAATAESLSGAAA